MLDGKFVSSQKVFDKVVVKGLDLGEEKVEHHLQILLRSVTQRCLPFFHKLKVSLTNARIGQSQ